MSKGLVNYLASSESCRTCGNTTCLFSDITNPMKLCFSWIPKEDTDARSSVQSDGNGKQAITLGSKRTVKRTKDTKPLRFLRRLIWMFKYWNRMP